MPHDPICTCEICEPADEPNWDDPAVMDEWIASFGHPHLLDKEPTWRDDPDVLDRRDGEMPW